MRVIVTLALAAGASFSWAVSAGAEEKSLPAAQNDRLDFRRFLRYRPLDLGQLLGRHFSEVVPGANWEGLPVPEEYKNPALRYGVFVRGVDLHGYMKDWDFMTDLYCVSSYSMFLMFFNRGFVFRIEFRYVPDSFTGTVKSDEPGFCADETPIFNMISKKLGGTVVVRQGVHELTQYTNQYLVKLSTDGHYADLSWDLRGGPSLPNF
jgi:hypothetical protein